MPADLRAAAKRSTTGGSISVSSDTVPAADAIT
jgi:hypothetical protein